MRPLLPLPSMAALSVHLLADKGFIAVPVSLAGSCFFPLQVFPSRVLSCVVLFVSSLVVSQSYDLFVCVPGGTLLSTSGRVVM